MGKTSYSKNGHVLRTQILPAPASHALLYDPVTYRTVAGNIQPFLADYIDSRLSIGWQLTYLSTEGKWDVKNLKKWSDVVPVSEPIGGIFRAMKVGACRTVAANCNSLLKIHFYELSSTDRIGRLTSYLIL